MGMYSERHYEAIADALARARPASSFVIRYEQWVQTLMEVVRTLKEDSPRFRQVTFIKRAKENDHEQGHDTREH